MIFLEYVGSRASLSANDKVKPIVSQQLAVDLTLYTYKNTNKLPDNRSHCYLQDSASYLLSLMFL